MNPQFKKGAIELCVLAIVSRRDYYGYELVKEISKSIEISEGTLYPILRRLTEEKHFEIYLKESSEGPSRKYYSIIKQGREFCKEQLKSWSEFNKKIDQLIHKDTK